MLAHNVFFSLTDPTDENCAALVTDCHQFLSDHPGIVFYSAGRLCKELDRPVNDHNFDVALHVVFDSKQNHDLYQEADLHNEFINKNKESWANVRVFDSNVSRP